MPGHPMAGKQAAQQDAVSAMRAAGAARGSKPKKFTSPGMLGRQQSSPKRRKSTRVVTFIGIGPNSSPSSRAPLLNNWATKSSLKRKMAKIDSPPASRRRFRVIHDVLESRPRTVVFSTGIGSSRLNTTTKGMRDRSNIKLVLSSSHYMFTTPWYTTTQFICDAGRALANGNGAASTLRVDHRAGPPAPPDLPDSSRY